MISLRMHVRMRAESNMMYMSKHTGAALRTQERASAKTAGGHSNA